MACTSLVALPRACGAEGAVAGLEKLWAIAHVDLDTTSGLAYTEATNGTVSAITLETGKKFIEVGLLKDTAGLNESLKKDVTKGNAYFEQKGTIVLGDLTVENRAWVQSVLNQPIAILIRTRTGKYFVAGLNGQFELETLEGGTGVAAGDQIGYSLSFAGTDTKLIRQVDSTIVAGLIA